MKFAQVECRLCHRLFCYFQITKPRLRCHPCEAIERRMLTTLANDFARDQRRASA